MKLNNIKYHSTLSRYFENKERYLDEEKRKPNTRKLVEQPWQQTKAELWDDVTKTLCDLLFIEAKIVNSMTYELIDDYNIVLKVLPEAQEEVRKEEERQARIKKYTDDMIAYASKWNEVRKKHREDPKKYPMPNDEDILLPEIIQSVEPWSDEKREKEIERIINNPTRLDKVRAYSQFVISESSVFTIYGTHPGFVIQHSCNTADYPPLLDSAKDEINNDTKNVLLLQKFRDPIYEPLPGLLKTLKGNTDRINSVSIASDGKKAILGSSDKTLCVWDLETVRCLHILKGHTEGVTSVAITPEGKRAISGSWDKTLRLWNLETGQCMNVFEGHIDEIESVAITPDGKRAISGSSDTLGFWDLESGDCLKILQKHTHYVSSVDITPDGKRAISGSRDRTVRLWDLKSGEYLKVLKGHTEGVTSVAITPDGKRVISGSADNTLRLWDLESGACLKVLKGHKKWVTSVAITPDGKRAISGSWDKSQSLLQWDLESGNCLKVLEGHKFAIHSVAITPDGKTAVSGSSDKTLRLWDLERGSNVKNFERLREGFDFIQLTSDGKRAVSGSSLNKNLRLWDLESGECIKILKGHTKQVNSIAIIPWRKMVLSGSDDKTLRLWDLKSGKCLKVLEGHTWYVNSIAITPDGKIAVSGGSDKNNNLRLWELESGKCLKVLEGHTLNVISVAITPDGKSALSGSDDKTLRLWDLKSGRCLKVLEGHNDKIKSVAITPDGKSAISGDWDNTLCLWDLESGECLKIIGGKNFLSFDLLTPDEKTAVSSNDDVISLWDLKNQRYLKVLNKNTCSVISFDKTTNGIKSVLEYKNNILRFSDFESGACKSLFFSNFGVGSLAYSSNLNTVILGEQSGNVLFIKPINLLQVTQKITIQRLWLFGISSEHDKWDENLTALCQSCGTRFKVQEKFISLIGDINKHFGIVSKMSPCLSLPDEAFENPGLLSECPNCKKPIKFNPFIVDNKENESYNRSNIADYSRDLFLRYVELGDDFMNQGKTNSAIENYELALTVANELFMEDPNSTENARDLVVCYSRLIKRDKLIEALEYMKNKNMYMDQPLVDACKQLGIENVSIKYEALSNRNNELESCESSLQGETTPEEVSLNELRDLAEKSFYKKQWEAAETLFRKMLEKRQPIDIIGPKIFTCILNAHSKLSDYNLQKLNDVLQQLESIGKTELVSELRKQLLEKTNTAKVNKKGSGFWNKKK